MKNLITLCIAVFAIFFWPNNLKAQNVAPDFYATDINGNEWHLQELLDSGKTVILEFSATWCGPCWNYHQTHALADLYELYGPEGTDDLMIFFIEADETTDNDDLFGLSENSVGDFGSTTPYPIIDGNDGADLGSLYQLEYYPYIVTVCQDGIYFESGQETAENHYSMMQNQCGFQINGPYPTMTYYGTTDLCLDTAVSSGVFLGNMGSDDIYQIGFELNYYYENGGSSFGNYEWHADSVNDGQPIQYGDQVYMDFGEFSGAGEFVLNIEEVNYEGWDDQLSQTVENAIETHNQITIEIIPDNWPEEIAWSVTDGNGYEVDYIQFGEVGPPGESNSWNVDLDSAQCYTIKIFDSYGDGMNASQWGDYYDGYINIYSNGPNPYIVYEYNGFIDGEYDILEIKIQSTLGDNEVIEEPEDVYGCTDDSAMNYNPEATEDDGSCSYGNLLYSEDFSNGFNDWTVYDDFNNSIWVWVSPQDTGYYYNGISTGTNHPGGEFSTNIGTLESPTESNGWVIFDNDYFNSPISDGVYDTNGHITSPFLDFSEQESVIVNWQQYYRYCCYPYAPIFLDVSIDGGMYWERFDAHGDFIESANAASANPLNTTVDISCIAAYQSNVQIRFTYEQPWEVGTGYSHYYWGIDDVIIYSNTTEYDVAITHFATADVVSNYDYYDIPLEQSQMIEITPGVGYQNNGLNDVNDLEIMINFSDSNGDTVWEAFEYVGYLESSTSSGSCPADISDTAIVYTAFSPWEIDDYTVTANIYSMIDGDENDSNNLASKRLSITENSFSHADFQNIDGHIGSYPEDEYIYRPAGFGSIYYLYSGAEAYGVNVVFGDSCGYTQYGNQEDLWFYLRVYEYNGNTFVHEWAYYEEFYFEFDPQWVGEEVFLPFDYPVYLGENNYAITIISDDYQEARLEVQTNNNYNPDNSTIRYNQSGDGDHIWFYNQTFTPAMSLYFGVPEDEDEDEYDDDTSINDPPSYNNVVWSSECEVDSCDQWEFGNDGTYDLDFYCSFDGPTGPYNTWAGADNGGDIAPPMNSSTNYNGLLIVDSDAYSGGGGSTENCWVQTINPIDCANLDDVTISFQTRYRCWDSGSNDGNERCYVEVSRDGYNWPSDWDIYSDTAGFVYYGNNDPILSRFEVFPTYETGDQTNNPEHISINISEPAAGQDQIWIRFRWVGIWGYSWEIDDIYVYQTPEYDMAIGDYFSYTDYEQTGIIEYGAWPLSQMPDMIQSGAEVVNNGIQSDLPLLHLRYQSDDGEFGTIYNGYQPNWGELSTGELDTMIVGFDPETLSTVYGTKYVTFFAGGQNGGTTAPGYENWELLDENLTNNEATTSFEITEYSYGRDNGHAYYTGPTAYNGYEDNCYAASTVYQIFDDTEIYGIDVAVMSGTPEGSWGQVFIGYFDQIEDYQGSWGDIYNQDFEYNDTDYNNEPGASGDDLQWYTIEFDYPVYLSEGENIYVGIFSEIYGDYGFKFGYSHQSHDYTSFLYNCNEGEMYWTERTPMIRLNLNPNLNEEEVIFGCTDPSACNYDPDANDDEGCFYYEEEGWCSCEGGYSGCTNPYSCEYDEMAECDDGSCEGGNWSCGYDGGFITAFTKMDYGYNVDHIHGDIYITRGNNQGIYNPYYEPYGYDGNWSPAGTLWKSGPTEDEPDPDSYVSWVESHGWNAMDLPGQTYSLYLPDYGMYWDVYYQSWTSGSNGGGFSWIRTFRPEQSGCTFEGGAGCMDEEACNYDFFANCEGDCDYESCGGCTDPNAPNYDPDATIDDGSCVGIDPTCDNIGLDGWGIYDSGVYPENSMATYAEYTTIDLALHINEMLNEPASGEDYPLIDFMLTDVQGLPDGMDSDEAQTVLTPIDQVCVTLYGTPYETGLFTVEFTGVATISLFGLELEINNFTFDHLLMIEENANPILGCTYEGALNYDMYANMDNGSCEFEGCTDEEALNYNDIFNVDDGSCIYNLTDPDCISDINMDGIVSTGDLLLLLSDFGNYCDE